jgi:hypothetical protein
MSATLDPTVAIRFLADVGARQCLEDINRQCPMAKRMYLLYAIEAAASRICRNSELPATGAGSRRLVSMRSSLVAKDLPIHAGHLLVGSVNAAALGRIHGFAGQMPATGLRQDCAAVAAVPHPES